MAKGTGIATYARNLNAAIRAIGLQSQILFGPEQGLARDPLLREIALVDAPPPPSMITRTAQIWRNLNALSAPLGRVARPVARTGEVVTRQVDRNLPACDGLWASRDLFHAANTAHSTLGLFTPLRLDRTGAALPDIMHWTCPLPLRLVGVPNLYTIHDLVPLRLPYATLDNKHRFLSLCREIKASAAHIVTVSEHSKQDIVRILGVEPERVSVTYQAVELPDAALAQPDTEVAKTVEGVFGLDWRGYYLFFGAIEPKKNLARVIEAYLASNVSVPLVIIGGRAWLDDDEIQMIYPDLVEISVLKDGLLRRNDRIRRYEYLPFALLTSLIRGARATLLPSLYEGFGLPALESMLLGTPVLTSTAGSLPEVVGDAALLVDPYDPGAIRDGILTLDGDPGLRADLADRGRRRAARFSPQAYRQRLGELYQSLL
jgi:glycosyltransferase involved in cell wall biosynthesis